MRGNVPSPSLPFWYLQTQWKNANSVRHLFIMRDELGNDQPDNWHWFPNWADALAGDAVLTPGVREHYRATIHAFLGFCRKGT
jgi:hypothetical protein